MVMTQPVAGPGQEVRDFTLGTRVLFRIDDDVFEGVPDLPSETALRFAADMDKLQEDDLPVEDRIDIMRRMFYLVLKPSSAERFIERMGSSEDPIGPKTLKDLIPWLFEQYAERPTEQDETSSDSSGNQEPGISSQENTPPAELTSGTPD